jgi:NAD+-dependent secondary alcohol dehydrogenase Adh1
VPGLPLRRRRALPEQRFPGIDSNGGYAELLRTSARSVVKLDDSLEPAGRRRPRRRRLTAYHAAAKASRA